MLCGKRAPIFATRRLTTDHGLSPQKFIFSLKHFPNSSVIIPTLAHPLRVHRSRRWEPYGPHRGSFRSGGFSLRLRHKSEGLTRLFANFTKAQRAFLKSIRDNQDGPERFPKPGTLDSWLQNPKFKETYEMLQRDIQREIDLRMLLLQRNSARHLTTPAASPPPTDPPPS